MACMGPDYDACKVVGEKLTDDVLITLEMRFGHSRPLVAPTDQHQFLKNMTVKSQKEWDKKVKELQAVLTELAWISACDSF